MADITERPNSYHLSTMISELANTVAPYRQCERDIDQRIRLKMLANSAFDDVGYWSEAISHIAFLVSTHDSADDETQMHLRTVLLMQGQLSALRSSLDEVLWCVDRRYDENKRRLVIDEVGIEED